MAGKKHEKWHRKRHRIGDACDWRCYYCGGVVVCPNCYPEAEAEYQATLDHVYPKSRGGGQNYANLVMACTPCNVDKADRILTDIRSSIIELEELPNQLTYSIGTRM